MPSPHNSVSVLSRSRGQSAVAAAAYRHATQMRVSRDELSRDYGDKRSELKHAEIALPGAAAWAVEAFGEAAFYRALEEVRDEAKGRVLTDGQAERAAWARVSEQLWTSVEDGEDRLNRHRKDAQLARTVTIALPAMLSRSSQIALMRGYVEETFTAQGMIADWVLHDKGDGNPHVHVMLTLREIGEEYWGLKNRGWNHVSMLQEQRALWASHANAMLEREGFAERIDHRTLEAQQLELGAEAGLKPESWNAHVADHADRAGDAARARLRCSEVREANRAYLRAHPEHILVVVQSERAVFSERDVRAAFAKRLGLDAERDGAALGRLVGVAMASSDLLPVAGVDQRAEGRAGAGKARDPLYITAGKARQVQQVARDAERLAGLRLAGDGASVGTRVMRAAVEGAEKAGGLGQGTAVGTPNAGPGPDMGAGAKAVGIATDALEAGTGPILIDIAGFGEGAGNEADQRDESDRQGAGRAPRGGRGVQRHGGLSGPRAGSANSGSSGHLDTLPTPASGAPGSQGMGSRRPGAAVSRGPAAAAVREALAARAEDLFRSVFGEPVRPGAAEWRAKENEATAMQIRGPKRGLWRDHSAGEGGDLLDLIARHYCGVSSARQDFPKVLDEAARWCGLSVEDSRPDAAALRRLGAKREKEAAVAQAQERARRAALVKHVAGRAIPVTGAAGGPTVPTGGSPAATYLAWRGITELPDEGLAYLPGIERGASPRGFPGPQHDALVVWATDETGVITGGQRILINPDGSKADVEVRKPSFGQVSGSVARFPARAAADGAPGPLVIAEGPESALSIRQATGYETWAVFGVSGWRHAPIPPRREVILAPDRDAPTSPAGRAFRKALAHHVARGCDLKVAPAPEPAGSRRDLNDTDQRLGAGAGPEAVRSAIAGAREVQPWLSPELNAGQRRAAEAMLGPDRLTLVTGHAGTGKTFTLGEVARVWRSRGVTVLAGAPSGKATEALAEIPDVQAATLAAWESRWARGQTPPRGNFVFLMDEAGMAGSGQWARLQSRIGAMGGKLVAIGDPGQLQPVMEVSGWALAERGVRAAGGDIPVMDVVMRQRDAGDRAATVALAGGDRSGIRAAIRHYAGKGAFRAPEMLPEVVALWQETGARGETKLVVVPSDPEAWALNAALREVEVARGAVDRADEVGVRIRRWTGAGPARAMQVEIIALAPGDRVMVTEGMPSHRLKANSLGTVVETAPGRLALAMDTRGMGVTDAVRASPLVEIGTGPVLSIDYGYAITGRRAAVDHALITVPKRSFRMAGVKTVTEVAAPDAVEVLAQAHVDSASATADLSERIAFGYSNVDVEALNGAIRAKAVARGLVAEGQAFVVERVGRSVKGDMPVVRRVRAEIRIGVGDRVMLTRPHRETNMSRSAFGTVTGLTENGFTLRMDGQGRAVEIDAGAFPYFDYGYAATVHKGQGTTVEESFVLPHRGMDRYEWNVVLTRHRERVTVFGRAQHCESFQALERLATRREPVPAAPRAYADVSMVPLPDTVPGRADRVGLGQPVPTGAFMADRHLMAVASRVAGLLGADQADNDPLLAKIEDAGGQDVPDYAAEPQRAVDDLVARQGVVLAEEVAGALARQVRDPETFLRLFAEAMAHEDLVALPRADGRAGDGDVRVYTTQALLDAELAAQDRGLRLAFGGRAQDAAEVAPAQDEAALPLRDGGERAALAEDIVAGLDADQSGALAALMEPRGGNLRIVEGGTGSGKTRLAARLAQAYEAAGHAVTLVSPTEAGRQALAAEGVDAVTLGMYLSEPVQRSRGDGPRRTVILDDAHGLGTARADVVLARVEAEQSQLIVMVNPERRPAEPGPVFGRLAERVRAPVEHEAGAGEAGAPAVATLGGLHGPETAELQALAEGLSASAGERAAAEALRAARGAGLIGAVGDREAALAAVARSYVADKSADKLALAWSRREAAALTAAIRARLDEIDPERAARKAAEHGPLKGLKPGDRIRFGAGGLAGSPAEGGARPAPGQANTGGVGQPEARLRRGERAEVLGPGTHGGLRLRVTGEDGAREIAVPEEGPLPAWSFAFASTVMASAGRRHESVHMLASPDMDREILAAGMAVAREKLDVVLPVAEDRLDGVLERIAGRARAPRSGLDYGFDPALSMEMAREAVRSVVPDRPGPDAIQDMTAEALTPEALAALTKVPRVSRGSAKLRAENAAYLKETPEHILAILAADRPVFTQADIRRGLRARLGGEIGEAELKALGTQVMRSEDLVKLTRRSPDGAPQYITRARAVQLGGLGADAARLAQDSFAPGGGPVLRPDALDSLNPVQALAAEAMLDARRLTLVTGHAGTGKTHTLKAVAAEWRARGVTVLAGAPSAKATDGVERRAGPGGGDAGGLGGAVVTPTSVLSRGSSSSWTRPGWWGPGSGRGSRPVCWQWAAS